MVSEIDWLSINKPLAQLLGLTVAHFNVMESAIFAGLDSDVGVTEELFKSKVQAMDKICLTLFEAQKQEKLDRQKSLRTKVTILASEPATPNTCESSSPNLAISAKSKFNTQSPKHAKLINTTKLAAKEEIKLVSQQDSRQTTNDQYTTSDACTHTDGDDENLVQKGKRLWERNIGNPSGFDVCASFDTSRSDEPSSSDTEEEQTMSANRDCEQPRVADIVAL